MAIYRGPGGPGDAVADAASEAALISALVTQAQTAETNAGNSASAAGVSATNAANSASTASTAATNAATSAVNAATSASAASTSATNAANSASAASTSETNAASSASAASSSASAASTSATNAATSASAASTSASNAASSASAAATSATNASNSASTASTAATNASNSASAASTSASNAATSETNAASSASAASTSASNAATSATNASNSASAASTSASNAATSETNASNSASAAATSATNASNSASSAATSATNAAASYDAFDDRYLGAKSSAPTLDNDGNALLTGALYWNTVGNQLYVWNGSAWDAAVFNTSGALFSTDIGVTVQAYDGDLNAIAGLAGTSGFLKKTAANTWSLDTNTYLTSETFTGTVTSVAMTVPTGLTVSGTPITSSGTFAVSLQSGYSIPTTAKQTEWDSAFTQRLQWDGGSTNLVAATGRTSLGATTIGSNLFTLTNPSAVRFPRFNADNTVSALSDSDFRTAIGAGTGNGTVTGVTATSPVASSGGTAPVISLSSAYGDTLNPYGSKTANFVLAAPNGSAGVPTFRAIVAADIPTLNQNTTGTASNVTGTVAIANGGTGQTTQQAAINALAGAVTSAQFLRGNGTNVVMSAIQVSDVPTLNQNTTGTASNVTGTVAVANGGTGATTTPNARTNLGATTLGSNLFTITNPSAITFPRFNADNTVSALNAADFRTAIGAGTSSTTGTVTSITAGTGLSGGTITTSGTIALANTAVTAGSYTNANITVDAQGRVTSASNGTGSGITMGKAIAAAIVFG